MAAGAGACAAAAFMAWSVRGRASNVFGPSVWRGPSDRRTVALTFDDGPSESTPQILDILAGYGATATFFQCGANVERMPEIARAVHQAGHQIGNHTYSHPPFYFRSPRFMEQELRLGQDAIEEHAGVRPRWFRAPYGVRWLGVGEAQRRLKLMGVMWTVIGYDWKLKSEAVVRRVASGVSNGAIVCLHDGRELRPKPDIGVTVEAVRRLVPLLLDQGFRFETVGRLICPTT
jgi:peptidoglycan/xylan/chitin deacetylase (PgdA/CDA1 family)